MTARLITLEEPSDFKYIYTMLASDLINSDIFDRGEWQAQDLPSKLHRTRELRHVTLEMPVPRMSGGTPDAWQEVIQPNLPWAEDHFQERVGGLPLNPPPSHERWPFAQKNNDLHRQDEKFSHTYPERFWPRVAGENLPTEDLFGDEIYIKTVVADEHQGIRFRYGDFDDLIDLLKRNINTRQAYLPIWFPEDLAAASEHRQRVPCSLGYHFLNTPQGMDCTYTIRSCDLVRHFRDDVYMAGRLLQEVCDRVVDEPYMSHIPGKLIMHIGSLHCFDGDQYKLTEMVHHGR